ISTDQFAAPDLRDDAVTARYFGVRPCRRGGPRIETEIVRGRPIVHQYGHGGAGVTLSWGSAVEAAALVGAIVAPPGPVAIAGSGVIGLSTAAALTERGYDVTIHARAMPPGTTSDVAAAMWWPVATARGETSASHARFDRIVIESWRRFGAMDAERYGIARLPVFETPDVTQMMHDLPDEILRASRTTTVDRIPVPGLSVGARRFETYRIDMSRYLPALLDDLRARGVRWVERSFDTLDDLATLDAPVVVNCLGLDAGRVGADDAVFGVRGALVRLAAQPGVRYMMQFGESYLIPREGGVVLGGTWDVLTPATIDEPPAPAAYDGILAAHRRFFGAGAATPSA
ncbi:MAG: FAD-dependent oxidoreductase, partial [Phycisphaerales bacterium]|nr:FAD-dependent oxidoreductase [Phycisphaerales bacterium]